MPVYKIKSAKQGLQKYRVRVNYTDASGAYRQVERTVAGLAEAKRVEAELIQGFKSSAPTMTVAELFKEYSASKKNDVRLSTYNKTVSICENHILPLLGAERLDKLTAPKLQGWKNAIAQKDLGVTMKKNIRKELNALLNYAVRLDYIPSNPLRKIGNFSDPYLTEQSDLKFYTPDEFNAFIRAAKADCKTMTDYGCYVFFCIAFYTGARKGEINALKWSDITDDTIHIRRSISQKVSHSDVETPPKNRSSIRDIQMPKPLTDILMKHKTMQATSQIFSEDFRICGGEAPLRDTTIENRNRRWSSAAGLKHIRIHDFRHSHASVLANNGINIQEIARRLGHANPTITLKIYSHLYPREQDRALDVLNGIVPDEPPKKL